MTVAASVTRSYLNVYMFHRPQAMHCTITVANCKFANASNIRIQDIRNSSQTQHKHKATHCNKTTTAMTRYLLLLFILNHRQDTRKIRRKGDAVYLAIKFQSTFLEMSRSDAAGRLYTVCRRAS
jgi:hypothetical protein